MDISSYIHVARYGIETAILVSTPVLLCGLIAGVGVSVFQAATQINDAALAFLPKILATVLSLVVFGGWMMSRMAAFATYAFNQIPMVTQ